MGFQTEHLEDQIAILKEANAQLADKIKIAVKALEFYANESDVFEGYSLGEDYSSVDIGDSYSVEVLGKRARIALGKIRE